MSQKIDTILSKQQTSEYTNCYWDLIKELENVVTRLTRNFSIDYQGERIRAKAESQLAENLTSTIRMIKDKFEVMQREQYPQVVQVLHTKMLGEEQQLQKNLSLLANNVQSTSFQLQNKIS
ncbi:MAG: hypothetical protein ACRCXC_13265 [Legionella sp.]